MKTVAFSFLLCYNNKQGNIRKEKRAEFSQGNKIIMYDFLTDLNEYFCEKYANYDKLCVLPGYRMPKMHDTRIDEYGRSYSYTLPTSTMRLAMQENKAELLALLKEKMVDKTFSFSFRPLSVFSRLRNKYSKKSSFLKIFKQTMARHNADMFEVGDFVDIPKEAWKNICKGNFVPTKNLLFTLALVMHLSFDDLDELLYYCNYEFDFTSVKDVVICYLVEQKVFNPEMVTLALKEYKVDNLFFKVAKE